MHVGRGQLQVAQARHLEFTEVAMLRPQEFCSRGVGARWIVVVGAEIDFVKDAAGKVTELILHQGGRDIRAPKVP